MTPDLFPEAPRTTSPARRAVIANDSGDGWEPIPLASIRCACGSAEITAIAPGDEPDLEPDLLTTAPGVPSRAWCGACWHVRFGWTA